ncbi:MAG TPA: radical SAM protein [Steroidobacteraceae bacterium]|nr:radical SAM protein [Steroidobacteraceae bacterium]
MTPRKHVLLINPTITSRRSARFPLAVLNLSAALEGRYASSIIDGNKDRDFVATALRTLKGGRIDAVGVSVMGGPQLLSAIAVSRALRAQFPAMPIIWGGHFPTIAAEAALNSPYVDYAVRGQGEETLIELLDAIFHGGDRFDAIAGLSWRSAGGVRHNRHRTFSAAGLARALPFERLGNPRQYLARTYLGRRTTGYQAALGCRFRCTFCGVAAMFRGKTALPAPERLEQDLRFLTSRLGVDAVQFYDHNFFDREDDTAPLLEVLAKFQLPWWCFARSDALLNLSDRSWALVRKSRLRMAYIGAESPSDWLLHDVRKGTSTDQTLEAVEKCRSNGVIPELSFMLAPPHDPEGETEKTFEFIRHIKRIHPETEIMLYVYAPLPAAPGGRNPQVERAVSDLRDSDGERIVFPATADGWAEPQWISYWCHTDVPWLTPRMRSRIRDFTTVLGCRFPTITDIRSPDWGKSALRTLASWRYRYQRYERPWELNFSRRFIRLWDPRVSGL